MHLCLRIFLVKLTLDFDLDVEEGTSDSGVGVFELVDGSVLGYCLLVKYVILLSYDRAMEVRWRSWVRVESLPVGSMKSKFFFDPVALVSFFFVMIIWAGE